MSEKMHKATCAHVASPYAPCDCGVAKARRHAALASKDSRPVCRGSYALGTACGHCDRCQAEADKASAARLREAEAGKLNAALVGKLEAAALGAAATAEEERPKANNWECGTCGTRNAAGEGRPCWACGALTEDASVGEGKSKANNYLDRMENLTQDNARLKRQMMELLMAFRDYAHEEFMRSVKEWKEENARKLRDTIDAIAHDSAPD